MTNPSVFIGIDSTQGPRHITYAILNDRLHIQRIATAQLSQVVEDMHVYPSALCAIAGPSGPNRGLMADPLYRDRLGLKRRRDRYSAYRVCEYELKRRGINIYKTPPENGNVPRWMQTCWDLYRQLRMAGFVDYPRPGSRRLVEVYPYAVYTVLAGSTPYPKNSVEGLLQRQLVLYEEGVRIHDPMLILEEWTRHHLRTGKLNLHDVLRLDQLDALAAAYTAFIMEREPENMTAVGDPLEGLIVVPTGALQDAY